MGLDMYLQRDIFIGANYAHRNIVAQIDIKEDFKDVNIDTAKLSTITEMTGQWRKAHHIHQWFVTNVQDGIDNCERFFVTKEKLIELREVCKKALVNRSAAYKLLPIRENEEAGQAGYDEWYFGDTEETVRIIDEALERDVGQFFYQASW